MFLSFSNFQQEKDAASLQSQEHAEAEKEAEKPESETPKGLGWKGFTRYRVIMDWSRGYRLRGCSRKEEG